MKNKILVSALALATAFAHAAGDEPIRRIDVYVSPYYAAASDANSAPQVSVGGAPFDQLLASTRREDILAARDRIQAEPDVITPMTLMVLAIRLYDVGERDDAVFWFYVAKHRYTTLAHSADVNAPALREAHSAVVAFSNLAGPYINSYAFCDVKKQQTANQRAYEWVRDHPYMAIYNEGLPHLPGAPKDNIEKGLAAIRKGLAEEKALVADPKAMAELQQRRKKNNVDAQFCWK